MSEENETVNSAEAKLSAVERAARAEVEADQSGLISTTSERPYPRSARFAVWLFLAVLVATAFIDRTSPIVAPMPVGIERLEYRKLQTLASFEKTGWKAYTDGHWMRLAEKRLSRTSRVRDEVTPYWALFLFKGLRSGRRNVRIGPDGWLFVEERLEPAKDPEQIVAGWPASILAALSRGIEAAGIRFSLVPVPRKEIVHKDRLPRGSDPRTGLMPKFMALTEEFGIETVDLMPAFEKLNGEPGYFRTDSHWAPAAEYLAARRTAHALGCLSSAEERLGEFVPGDPVRGGFDLLELLGLPRSLILEAGLDEQRRSWTGAHETGANRGTLTSEKARLAIAGTSFSARRYYPLFLAHFFGEPIYNGARIGGNPMNPLEDLLKRDPRPEHIILEVPGHALFNTTPLPTAGDVVPQFDLPGAIPVCRPNFIHITKSFRNREFKAPRRKVLAQTSGIPLGHTGDGVLWWRVRGEVQGDNVGVTYMLGERRFTVPWPQEKRELLIPICNEEPTWLTGALILHAAKAPRMRIDSVELVAFAVEEGAVDFEAGALQSGAEPSRGRQAWTPAQAATVPAGGMLIVDLVPETKEAVGGFVTVEIEVEGGETFVRRVYAPKRGVALIGVDKIEGQEIETVTFSGDFGQQKSIFARVRLHGTR